MSDAALTRGIKVEGPLRDEDVLVVDDLRTHFATRAGLLKAVDGVSFRLGRGRILGVVGESGSGKSVMGFSILGLVDPPGEIVGGRILFHGRDLTALPENEMRALRGARIAMIFQDPTMTLDPIMRIEMQMVEALQAHQPGLSRAQARELCIAALAQVGISSPAERMAAYPHQFSGGMRQRVAIAIAFLNKPDLIIADEPTTALDVTIQAQILSQVQKLCRESGTALIWISHDLSVVAGLADDICVMYAGRVVELGTVGDVLDHPLHPYTSGLLAALPRPERRGERFMQIPGAAPIPIGLPRECGFRPRCPRAREDCRSDIPMRELRPGHFARCLHPKIEAA
jgi:peptide/nickel transport system ATP-binding protein